MYLDAAGNVIRQGVDDHRPPRRRRARHGRRPRGGAGEVRHDEARRADRAGDPPRRAGLRARAGRCRHARCRGRGDQRADPATAAIFLRPGPALGRGRPAGAARPRARRCGRSRDGRRRRLLQGPGGAGDRRLEPRRQGPDHAGRPRPLRRPASWRRSSATTAAFASSRRRRRAPAASSSARSSTSSRAIRSRTGASARRGRCTCRSRRCATPISTATATSAIPTSSTNPLDAPARQGLRGEDPRRDRPGQRAALSTDLKPGIAAARGQQHHPLLDRRRQGNAVAVTYTLNDWFGAKVTAARHRRAAEQRDGRLHRQARRAQHLRPGAGRGERDRAGQAAAQLDDARRSSRRTASR